MSELYNSITTCLDSNPSVCCKKGRTKKCHLKQEKNKVIFDFISSSST